MKEWYTSIIMIMFLNLPITGTKQCKSTSKVGKTKYSYSANMCCDVNMKHSNLQLLSDICLFIYCSLHLICGTAYSMSSHNRPRQYLGWKKKVYWFHWFPDPLLLMFCFDISLFRYDTIAFTWSSKLWKSSARGYRTSLNLFQSDPVLSGIVTSRNSRQRIVST